MIHPRTWKHDSASTFCMDCRRPFALLRRRHHCRHCGGLFCADCTAQRLWLRPIFDPLVQRRPELTCNIEHTSHTEAVVRTRSSSTSSDSSSRGSNTVQTTAARKIDSNGGMSCGNDEAVVPLPLKSCEASATQPRIGAVTDVATLVTQRSSTTMALTCSGTLVIEDNTEQIHMLDTYNANDDSEGSGRSPDVLQQTTRQVQGDEQLGQQPLTPPTTAHTLNGEEECGSKQWMLWDEAEAGGMRGEVVVAADHATPPRDTSAHSSLSTPSSHASIPQEAQQATTSDLTLGNTAAANNMASTIATQQQQQQEMQDDRLWWLWNPIAHQSREGTWWFLARVCRTCYTELMNGLGNTSPTTTATTTSSIALCRRRSTTSSSKRAGFVRVGGRPLARFATATIDGEEDDSVNNDVCADRAVDDPVEEVEEDEEETPSLTSLFAAAWGALRRRVKSQSRQSSEVDMGAISSTTSATSEAAEERHITMKRAQQQQQQRVVTVATGGKPSRMAGHDEIRSLPQAEASHAQTTLLAARTARDLARITALARRERRVCVVLIDERGSARRETMQPVQEPAQMRWYGITNTTTTTTSSSHSTVERVGEERTTMRHPPSCSSPPQSSRVSGNSSFIMEVSGAGNILPFPAPRQSPLRADNTVGCTPEHGAPTTPSQAQRSRSNSTSTLLAPVLPACTDRHRSRYHTLHLLLNELQDNNNIHSNSTAMSSEAGGGGSAAMTSEITMPSHTASGAVQRSSASQQLQRVGQERLSLMAAQRPQPRSPCLQAGGTVLLAAIQQQAATNARRQPSPHHSVPSSDPTSESRSMTGNATNESYSHATTMIGAAVMGPGGQRLGSSLSTLHQGSASCSCGPSWAAEAALTDHFSSAGHHRRSMQRRIVLELPVKLCFPVPASTSPQQQGQAKTMNGLQESNITTTTTRDDKSHSEAVIDALAPIRRSTRMPLLSPPVSPMLQRGKGPVIVVHSPHMNAASTTTQEGVVPPPLPTPCQLPGAAVGSFGRVTSASDAKGTRATRPQTTATPPPPTLVTAGGGTVSVASVAARVELMGLVASAQDGLESGPAVSAMVNASRPFPFALFAHDASTAGMATGGPGTSSAAAAAAAVATAAAAGGGGGTGTGPCSAHLCPLLQQLTSVSVRTHAYLFVILRGESPSGLTQGEQATMSYSALDALYDPSMPEFARPGVARRASATMQASLMRSAAYNISTGAGSSHTGAAGGPTPSSSHSQHAASSHTYYNNSSGNGGSTSMASNGVADLYARPSRRPFSGAELYHVYQHIQSCGGSVPPMAVLDVGPHVTRHRPHTSTTTIAEEGITNNNNFTGTNKAAHNVNSARLPCHEMWGTAADRTRRHSGGSMMDLARAHDAGAALAMNSVKQMARRLGLQYTRHHYPSETSVDVKAGNAPAQGDVSGSNVCTDEETLRSISQLLTSEEDCASPLPSTTTPPLQAATPQCSASCDTSCFKAALRGVVATLVQRDLRALQQCGE